MGLPIRQFTQNTNKVLCKERAKGSLPDTEIEQRRLSLHPPYYRFSLIQLSALIKLNPLSKDSLFESNSMDGVT